MKSEIQVIFFFYQINNTNSKHNVPTGMIRNGDQIETQLKRIRVVTNLAGVQNMCDGVVHDCVIVLLMKILFFFCFMENRFYILLTFIDYCEELNCVFTHS